MSDNQLLMGGGIIASICRKSFKWYSILTCILMLGLTSCYKDDIANLQSQIDQLKGGEIATISSQIKAIDASITDLKKVDETIEGLIAELQKDGENYAAQIAELVKMDSKLDEKIAELQQYTDGELAKQIDWVNATFATLEQLEALSETVAGLGVKIGEITESLESAKKEITESYEKAICEAVSSLEESMKQWVNEQLADYYTIAQTDAALKALEEKYDKVDEDLKKELEEQKTALEDTKKEITEAYKKAIEEAITAHDGKINEKIAKDIAAAKKELQDQIDTINTEIASIKSRLVKIETDIESLINRIQSIVVIPQDADGSVTVDASGTSTICFDIKPVAIADSIAKVWNALEEKDRGAMISVKLKSLSEQGEKVPTATIKSISIVDNEFKMGVKFTDLSQRSLASLQIMFGQSDITSEYFTLWPSSVPKNYVVPTGIAILNVNPIHLTTGTQASIEFRVNPSNATFTFSGENSQIELDMVGTVQTKSSYVTTPSNYKLVRVEYVFEAGIGENGENGDLKVGQYRAIIEDTKHSAEYDEMAALVLNVKDANGDDVQISSSAFEVVGHNFDNLPKTGLPIVVINTPNAEPINSKDVWKDGTTMTIINSDMTFDYQGTLGIKGRGNSTWGYPKKPYALKLDSKSKILGMPKHKRWCLLANWMDRTMIRNAVAFEIARKCPGLEWTPRGEFVEVVLNGTHIGNYYLCEQIKVDKNRVDIAELDDKVTEGDGITGGFIMELDTYYDEVNKFKSARRDLPWMFKDPDEVNSAQFTYMQNYVNAMEDALYDDAKFAAREFTNYMDLESFVDWWFVYELAMNSEPYWPKSSYMHKDKNGVIKAGPVWDFDYATFIPGNSSSFIDKTYIYYGRLFEDAGFKSLVKTKWQEQKSKYEEIGQFIDAMGARLSESDELNHIMWPISSTVNGDESMNYDEAVSRMKTAYLTKLSWMDTQISSW